MRSHRLSVWHRTFRNRHLPNAAVPVVDLVRDPAPMPLAGTGIRRASGRTNGGPQAHAATWAATRIPPPGIAERVWTVVTMIDPVHHANSAESNAVYGKDPCGRARDVPMRSRRTPSTMAGRGTREWRA